MGRTNYVQLSTYLILILDSESRGSRYVRDRGRGGSECQLKFKIINSLNQLIIEDFYSIFYRTVNSKNIVKLFK